MKHHPGQRVILDYMFHGNASHNAFPRYHKESGRHTGVVLPWPSALPNVPSPQLDDLRRFVTAIHWDDNQGCGVVHPETGQTFTLVRDVILDTPPQSIRDLLCPDESAKS